MYLFEDPGTKHQYSVMIEDRKDLLVCKRAVGPTRLNYEESLRLHRTEPPALLSPQVSEAVMRGLAYISLGYFGPAGYASLTQSQADQRIAQLFGDNGESQKEISTLG